jgi:flagellar motor switch protein FliG
LLTSLGDETSAAILRELTEEEVHDVTREISLLGQFTPYERTAVLRDFLKATEDSQAFSPGGVEYATSVLVAAFGQETGKRMADRLIKSIGQDTVNVDSLRKADPQHLAKIVHREHPQTIALILCHLSTANAARLLSALPEDLRAQVARRMASLDQVSPEIINRLAKVIGAKLRILGESSLESCGGVRAVAELLNRIDATASENILNEICGDDPTLGQTIRQLMFVFEDLVNINQDGLRKLIAQIDRNVLTVAFKGSSPQVRKHFTSVMSTRAADMLTEDMQALGPVRIRDVQEAQQTIIAKARQLQESGEISLQSGSGEEYVE